jgi:hypothetical protein
MNPAIPGGLNVKDEIDAVTSINNLCHGLQ